MGGSVLLLLLLHRGSQSLCFCCQNRENAKQEKWREGASERAREQPQVWSTHEALERLTSSRKYNKPLPVKWNHAAWHHTCNPRQTPIRSFREEGDINNKINEPTTTLAATRLAGRGRLAWSLIGKSDWKCINFVFLYTYICAFVEWVTADLTTIWSPVKISSAARAQSSKHIYIYIPRDSAFHDGVRGW